MGATRKTREQLTPGRGKGGRRVQERTWDFDRWAENYDNWVSSDSSLYARYDEVLERVLVAAEVGLGKKVLDIGTGTGNLALGSLRRGAVVVGLDPSGKMLVRAREKATELGTPAVGPVQATFLQVAEPFLVIPYPDATFDAVVSTYAFHHVPRHRQPDAIREMLRVLAPAGSWAVGDLMFVSAEAEREALSRYEWLEEEYFVRLDELAPALAQLGLTLRTEQFTPVTWVVWATKLSAGGPPLPAR
jgi:putative AdoMet-dependent methyltransferase